MHTVLLVNKDLRGQQIQPCSGKSGKLYGTATYNPIYSCPVFVMSLEEYEKAADDIMGNTFAGQQWIPVFKLEAEPAPAVPLLSEFDHLGVHFELTNYGIKVAATKITIEALQAFSREVDPKLWFRLIHRSDDGVVTIESKREEAFAEAPPTDYRPLLSLFTINELRALAKKLKVDRHGTRDDLMATISEKVSTE